jgi:hypothetical protein
MATIFRAPLITAIAALSTTAANSAQLPPTWNLLLFPSGPAQQPFYFHHQWPTPAQLGQRPSGLHHYRPEIGPKDDPRKQRDWPVPSAPGALMRDDVPRNLLLLPPPLSIGDPVKLRDWPTPARLPLKPDTHLFYYMQDQTSPAFIQYDWPKAPQLPTVDTPPIRNPIVFPVVIMVQDPFKQRDWVNPAILKSAFVTDPYNFNVFLPAPQGQAKHQHDWPNPQGAKSQQGSHTLNDLGLLSLPIFKPVKPLDWPNPKPVPQSAQARNVREPSVSILLVQRFKPEWAADSNQLLGPTRTQPETH